MKSEISIKAAIYLRAAELVEIGHCKGKLAIRANGDSIDPAHDDAVAFCYNGAIARAAHEFKSPDGNWREWKQWGTPDIVGWNNKPERTAAEVAAKLREQAFKE